MECWQLLLGVALVVMLAAGVLWLGDDDDGQ